MTEIEIPKVAPDSWERFFQPLMEELMSALPLHGPMRAYFHSIEVDHVTVDDDGVAIDYSYQWEVYMGCDDMDERGDDSDIVVGKRVGNVWVFEKWDAPVRAPSDEL